MNIARVGTRLCWNVCDAVAADHVSTEEISTREAKDQLRPPSDVEATIGELKGEIPNDSSICLRRFVGMLTGAGLISRN